MAASKSEASGGRRKKTGGRPRTAAGRPGVSWLDRLHHAREVVQLKDNEGLTWPQVAERTGRPKTTCERLYRDFKRNGDLHPDRDAWAWVYRRLDALTLVMEKAAETYAAAPAGSAVQVGALKAFEMASEKSLELARWVGWTPRQLGALSAERAMQEMFREMAAIAERYDAPDEMVQAFLDLAERKLSGRPVIEGTASGA
jgi:hypothetical protein